MPKLTQRKIHLKKARQRVNLLSKPQQSCKASAELPHITNNDSSDQSSLSDTDTDFDPEEALRKDPTAIIEEFCEDWVNCFTTYREDLYALSLLLFQILQQELVCPAAKIIAKYHFKNHKTIQKWRVDFLKNEGEIPQFFRGKYERMSSVLNHENLTEQARQYVRQNAFRKGAPNMTARSFCTWVNNELQHTGAWCTS